MADGYNEPMNSVSNEQLEALLLKLRAGVNAAEVHGALSGFLCAGGRTSADRWGEALALDALSEAQADRGEAADALRLLHETLVADLADPEDRFAPSLPDDDIGLLDRANALVAWCRGFLGGVGLANPRARGELSEEAEEAISDLGKIAASALTVDGDEADEDAYA